MEQLALRGGSPAKTKPFPPWPYYDANEERALLDVLHSGVWWRTPGTQTRAFEEEFAAYHQARHGIAVTNGTAALEVVLHALGIQPGDEVIVPDFTFVATASAVLATGALPVLVDVTADTYCLDPALAEAAITPQTKAIIAVHLGGHPADLDALTALCTRHGLLLVEDCAHAHGSQWRGRSVGTWGVAGTFSFQQSKLLTAGEGGCIITNDDDAAGRIRSVHDCGRLPGEWFYAHFGYGSNYRLSEWQGALLRTQLARLPEQDARRSQNSAYLDEMLAQIPGLTPQARNPRCTHNGQYAYIVHCDSRAFADLPVSRVIAALTAEGVPIQASYPPIHAMALFQNGSYRQRLSGAQREAEHAFLAAPFAQTARGAWETIWLPQTALLGDEQDTAEIVAAFAKIQRAAETLAMTTPLEIHRWEGVGYAPLVFSAGWQTALLNWEPIFDRANLGQIERHNATDEVFVLVAGRAAMFVTAGAALSLVEMEPGVVYNVPRGVWHNLVATRAARWVIVENRDTHLHDTELRPLTAEERAALVAQLPGWTEE